MNARILNQRLAEHFLQPLQKVICVNGVKSDSGAVEPVTRTWVPICTPPSTVGHPRNVDEVQSVARSAGASDVPLQPGSTGKNWNYGERSAACDRGITMILAQTPQTVQVDEQRGCAVNEPGVTQMQFNDHLEQADSRLRADSTDTTQLASIIGNALDKGCGLTSLADRRGCRCGLDLVLPACQLRDAGGAVIGRNAVRQDDKWGVGPEVDDLFIQNYLSEAALAGIWLVPAPEVFDFAAFEYKADPARLSAVIDNLRALGMSRAFRSHPHLANNFAMTCIVAPHPTEPFGGVRHLNAEAATRHRHAQGVAHWKFGAGPQVSREEVRYQKCTLRKMALAVNRWLVRSSGFTDALPAALPCSVPTGNFERQEHSKSHRKKPVSNIDPTRDGYGFVCPGPVGAFNAEPVMRALEITKQIFDKHDFDCFVRVIVESACAETIQIGVVHGRHDLEVETARAQLIRRPRGLHLRGLSTRPQRRHAQIRRNRQQPHRARCRPRSRLPPIRTI